MYSREYTVTSEAQSMYCHCFQIRFLGLAALGEIQCSFRPSPVKCLWELQLWPTIAEPKPFSVTAYCGPLKAKQISSYKPFLYKVRDQVKKWVKSSTMDDKITPLLRLKCWLFRMRVLRGQTVESWLGRPIIWPQANWVSVFLATKCAFQADNWNPNKS